MVLVPMKFHHNISNSQGVVERTRLFKDRLKHIGTDRHTEAITT